MSDETRFITSDTRMTAGTLHDVDKQVLESAAAGEGIELTKEQVLELAARARERKREFDVAFRPMLRAYAVFVRDLRVDQKCTWRAVAHHCAEAWGGSWGSNQLAGIALCERAAAVLGEDPNAAPWN